MHESEKWLLEFLAPRGRHPINTVECGGFLFFVFYWPWQVACGISVFHPGIEPEPLQWKHWILTTRPPGNSQYCFNENYKWTVLPGTKDYRSDGASELRALSEKLSKQFSWFHPRPMLEATWGLKGIFYRSDNIFFRIWTPEGSREVTWWRHHNISIKRPFLVDDVVNSLHSHSGHHGTLPRFPQQTKADTHFLSFWECWWLMTLRWIILLEFPSAEESSCIQGHPSLPRGLLLLLSFSQQVMSDSVRPHRL